MSRSRPQVLIAGFVLVAGIAALAAVGLEPEQPVVEPVATTAPVAALDPAVQGVLGSRGLVEVRIPDQSSQLPPEVARVLAAYGKGLAVPTTSGDEG